jgi:flagellar hook-associated protein 2
MSTITAPTYDPTTTAQALAQKNNAAAQSSLTSQTAAATATATALAKLGSAISTFQSSLSTLTGTGKTVLSQAATLSDTAYGSASASGRAVAGTYDFFVQQVATAGQATYSGLTDSSDSSGKLRVQLGAGTTGFDVDLGAAAGGDTTLTVRELAAAINNASSNAGKVSASVVTFGTNTQLVLSATQTGAASAVSLKLDDANGSLKTALANNVSATVPQDAIAWVGGKSGTQVQQSSNTFTNVDGLSVTFTKAQASGDANLTVAVKTDTSGTAANVKSFVDAYNALKKTLDGMVASANADTGAAAGAFASDAGVLALQSRLVSLLRPATGSSTLASFGITAQRDGTLALDSARLTKQLALAPDGLDRLLGSTSPSGSAGVATALDTYLDQWSGVNGQIKQRTDANGKQKTDLTKRQETLDTQYDAAYARYLKQFTDLQTLQSTMNSNVSLFDALFSSDKSS